MSDSLRFLLADTMPMLLELYREAVRRDLEANPAARPFESGRRLALYEALSLLDGQARAFGIPLTELGFPSDFDPDRDLSA